MKKLYFDDIEKISDYYWRNFDFQVSSGLPVVISEGLFFDGLKRYNDVFLKMIDTLYLKGFFSEVIFNFDSGIKYDCNIIEEIKRKMLKNVIVHNAEEIMFYNYATLGVPDDYYFMYDGNRKRMVQDFMESLSRLEAETNIIVSNTFSFSLSDYEKLMCAYLYIQRKYMYSSNSKDNDIIGDAEDSQRINSVGANNILKHLLEHLDYTFGDVIIKSNEEDEYHPALFVKIDDRKYNIHGCYVLDIGEDLKQSKYRKDGTYSLTNFCLCLNEFDRKNTTIFSSKKLSFVPIKKESINSAFENVDSISSMKDKKRNNKYRLIRVLKSYDNN